jgi:Geranylgeranyl pyrophosphate synthase
MAFHIKDYLLDYGGAQSGKPTGIDLKERKMTLPLIYTLNRCSWAERRRLIYVVRNQSERSEKAAWVMHVVRERGGLSYSQQKMAEYVAHARTLLHQFRETPARQALDDLVTFTIEREV